jgi:hypothetical protein
MSAQMAAAIKANPSAYPGYADPSTGKNTYTYPSANPGSVAQTSSFGTPSYRW